MKSVARADCAASAEQLARAAIATEMQSALALSTDDAAVDAFAMWLPRGRAAVARACHELEAAQDEITQVRAALSLARAAAEAVDQLIEARNATALMELQRKQQIELDDFSHRRITGQQPESGAA